MPPLPSFGLWEVLDGRDIPKSLCSQLLQDLLLLLQDSSMAVTPAPIGAVTASLGQTVFLVAQKLQLVLRINAPTS